MFGSVPNTQNVNNAKLSTGNDKIIRNKRYIWFNPAVIARAVIGAYGRTVAGVPPSPGWAVPQSVQHTRWVNAANQALVKMNRQMPTEVVNIIRGHVFPGRPARGKRSINANGD